MRKLQDTAGKAIRRKWGDVEVVDAKEDLRVMIVPQDVKSAVRKDPACCVFAQACKRTFGSSKVLFFQSTAYVELPDAKGKIHVERFEMTHAMARLVEDFDLGKKVIPKAGFLLRAPSANRTLERRRVVCNLYHKKRREEGTAGENITGRRMPVTARNGRATIAHVLSRE